MKAARSPDPFVLTNFAEATISKHRHCTPTTTMTAQMPAHLIEQFGHLQVSLVVDNCPGHPGRISDTTTSSTSETLDNAEAVAFLEETRSPFSPAISRLVLENDDRWGNSSKSTRLPYLIRHKDLLSPPQQRTAARPPTDDAGSGERPSRAYRLHQKQRLASKRAL